MWNVLCYQINGWYRALHHADTSGLSRIACTFSGVSQPIAAAGRSCISNRGTRVASMSRA